MSPAFVAVMLQLPLAFVMVSSPVLAPTEHPVPEAEKVTAPVPLPPEVVRVGEVPKVTVPGSLTVNAVWFKRLVVKLNSVPEAVPSVLDA